LVYGAVGLYDDYLKVTKQSAEGFRGRIKIVIEAFAAVAATVAIVHASQEPLATSLTIPFFKGTLINLGWLYILFGAFIIVGAGNAVNLTDGLDGLAAGCAAIVFLAFTAMTFITQGQGDLALLSACLVGACVGFLWFNSFPASVFMGDTGSLGLGGAIAGLSVVTKNEVLLIIIGGIFVIEALSVAIQVFSFQRFRKRVFLMAPIHHHFELVGWSETKIILRFWIVAAICGAVGFTLYQASITP
jgi:phospho-N-acetylmuramoyl-pentapeptide-transferase